MPAHAGYAIVEATCRVSVRMRGVTLNERQNGLCNRRIGMRGEHVYAKQMNFQFLVRASPMTRFVGHAA